MQDWGVKSNKNKPSKSGKSNKNKQGMCDKSSRNKPDEGGKSNEDKQGMCVKSNENKQCEGARSRCGAPRLRKQMQQEMARQRRKKQ